MSLKDLKVTDEEFSSYGVISQPDTLTGTPEENKAVFDALIRRVSIEHINKLIDELSTSGAADMGTEPFGAVTATTVQAALEQIYALIGSTYSGTDGAGKVGYTPSEGVDEDTVQEAIEAVQANLEAYIAKIKAATGAAEVGNALIAGMTATNVQQALEELRENIDNIVSGIIPGGSITSDMLQDGAVTEAKLNNNVVAKLGVLGGATTPQGALANLGAGVRPNIARNPAFAVNQRNFTSDNWTSGYGPDGWDSAGIGYLTFSGSTICCYGQNICQRYEAGVIKKGKYTVSALCDGQIYVLMGYLGSEITVDAISTNYQNGIASVTLDIPSDNDEVMGYIYIRTVTSGGEITYVKIEQGSTQTLAYQDSTGAWQLLPQPESDYATQLAKCQRYLYALESITMCPGGVEDDNLIFGIRFPVEMRIAPVFIGAEGGNNLQLYVEGSSGFYENQNFTLQWSSRTGATIKCQSPISLPPNSACNGRIDGKLMFSAEL